VDFRKSIGLPVLGRGVVVTEVMGDVGGSPDIGAAKPRSYPTRARGSRPCSTGCPQGWAEWEAVLAGCPSVGFRLHHLAYMFKEWWENLHQLHSDGAGLVPGQVAQHISEEDQDPRLDIGVAMLKHLQDVWQEGLHFSCLHQRQSFPFVRPTVAGRAFRAVSPLPDSQLRPSHRPTHHPSFQLPTQLP